VAHQIQSARRFAGSFRLVLGSQPSYASRLGTRSVVDPAEGLFTDLFYRLFCSFFVSQSTITAAAATATAAPSAAGAAAELEATKAAAAVQFNAQLQVRAPPPRAHVETRDDRPTAPAAATDGKVGASFSLLQTIARKAGEV
jgi:hypothetical protein